VHRRYLTFLSGLDQEREEKKKKKEEELCECQLLLFLTATKAEEKKGKRGNLVTYPTGHKGKKKRKREGEKKGKERQANRYPSFSLELQKKREGGEEGGRSRRDSSIQPSTVWQSGRGGKRGRDLNCLLPEGKRGRKKKARSPEKPFPSAPAASRLLQRGGKKGKKKGEEAHTAADHSVSAFFGTSCLQEKRKKEEKGKEKIQSPNASEGRVFFFCVLLSTGGGREKKGKGEERRIGWKLYSIPFFFSVHVEDLCRGGRKERKRGRERSFGAFFSFLSLAAGWLSAKGGKRGGGGKRRDRHRAKRPLSVLQLAS